MSGIVAGESSPDFQSLSRVGRGQYVPQRLKRPDEKHVEKSETSFEECARGRNSAANEWSAFGTIGNMDFNAMGRELWVRYPAFELEFRMQDGNSVIEPGQLESFRLGLVNNRLPAIGGGWQYGGLFYKVSVMTVPSPQCGNFDLYKLEVRNPTAQPLPSKLFAAVNGPPDMNVKDGILHGLGEIKDPTDPRYGLIEPGAMEVMKVGAGTHMYYLDAFAVLGLREAADAAKAVGAEGDARLH
jgi:hypothetical protein